jgi:hypothetical protein
MALIFSLGSVSVGGDSLSQLELLGFSCFSDQEVELATLVNKTSAQADLGWPSPTPTSATSTDQLKERIIDYLLEIKSTIQALE